MSTPQSLPGRALTDYLHAKASKARIPISGTFELSPVCNFSCRMCYVRKTQKEVNESPRKILSLQDWLRIAREAREAGMLYLLLTGGEPLLWPDFWCLYDELIDMGFLVSINTNASLIDEKALLHFKRKPPLRINITLYGACDETYKSLCGVRGVFDKVDYAIRGLMETGISVKINCSLTPQNASDLEWIVAYAKSRDAVLSVTSYMFPPIRRNPNQIGSNERFTPEDCARYMARFWELDRGTQAYRQHLRSILNGYAEPLGLEEGCVDPVDGKIRCRAGTSSFWVTWDGWLTPCGMMPVPQEDLSQMPFPAAWEVLVQKTVATRLSGVCSKCSNRNICHACAAIAYAETGSCQGIPEYMCRMAREMCCIARETLESDKDKNILSLDNQNSRNANRGGNENEHA